MYVRDRKVLYIQNKNMMLMDKYGWNCKTKLEHYCALFEFSASRQGETELLFRRKKKAVQGIFHL